MTRLTEQSRKVRSVLCSAHHAEVQLYATAIELPHTEVILTKKDEQRCRRHAMKMQLRGKFGQEADRYADQP